MGAMTIRAIRGATSLERDEREHLLERTRELLEQVLTDNAITPDDVVSVLFTCTPDIHSEFPAVAARELGFGAVPLMCAQEIDVAGALPLAVRITMHVETDKPREDIRHIYRYEAVNLRRDIAQ